MRTSHAFTIIELIFVIVVLGILASVALPKFASTGTQARIAAGKADVSAIRSAILAERQKRIIQGDSTFITPANLDPVAGSLFGGVLTYAKPDSAAVGNWNRTAQTATTSTYNYNVDGTNVQFIYYSKDVAGPPAINAGTFTCDPAAAGDAGAYCKQMIY
jgi:general secretion pathway protein G